MPVYKNKDNGTWYVMTQYTDWKGERKPKCKRGFATKREAQDWEQKFQQQNSGDLDMPFSAFVEIYCREQQPRLKESTWQTKENIIQQKILPYFKDRKINEITTKDVRAWQNEMLAYRNEENKPYSSSYLKTLHNQLSAIFNYAVRFYDLRSNPASKAGNMGSEERKEMLFWTKEEYQKFSEVMMDKPLSYYAFQMLYWTGIREGELLALILLALRGADDGHQNLILLELLQRSAFLVDLLLDQFDLDAAGREGVGGFVCIREVGQRAADDCGGNQRNDQTQNQNFLFHVCCSFLLF